MSILNVLVLYIFGIAYLLYCTLLKLYFILLQFSIHTEYENKCLNIHSNLFKRYVLSTS